MAKKMGRPPIEISDKAFDTFIQLPLPKIDIANALGVSEDTLERYVKDRFGYTYAEAKATNKGIFKGRILAKQYEGAMKGNTALLIWLGKQHLGQADKHESKDTTPKEAKESPNDQLERIKQMLKDEA